MKRCIVLAGILSLVLSFTGCQMQNAVISEEPDEVIQETDVIVVEDAGLQIETENEELIIAEEDNTDYGVVENGEVSVDEAGYLEENDEIALEEE